MTITRKRGFSQRSLALGLALAMLCPPSGGLLAAAQAQGTPAAMTSAPPQAGPIHTILLFPLSNAIPASGSSGGFNPDLVGARVEDAIKLRLNVIGRYKANSFSPTLPQIQRALSEPNVTGTNLSDTDLAAPYTDAAKAQKIAAQVGTDGYLLGSIDAVTVDPKTRNVSVSVSALLYNTATGGVVKTLGYTGKGVSYNAADDPDNLLQSAINDAAGHVVSSLNAGAPDQTNLPTTDFKRGHHDNSGSILLGILLAAAVGIAISSSHHSSGGGGSSSSGSGGGGTDTGGPPNPPSSITPSSSGPPAAPNP